MGIAVYKNTVTLSTQFLNDPFYIDRFSNYNKSFDHWFIKAYMFNDMFSFWLFLAKKIFLGFNLMILRFVPGVFSVLFVFIHECSCPHTRSQKLFLLNSILSWMSFSILPCFHGEIVHCKTAIKCANKWSNHGLL